MDNTVKNIIYLPIIIYHVSLTNKIKRDFSNCLRRYNFPSNLQLFVAYALFDLYNFYFMPMRLYRLVCEKIRAHDVRCNQIARLVFCFFALYLSGFLNVSWVIF